MLIKNLLVALILIQAKECNFSSQITCEQGTCLWKNGNCFSKEICDFKAPENCRQECGWNFCKEKCVNKNSIESQCTQPFRIIDRCTLNNSFPFLNTVEVCSEYTACSWDYCYQACLEKEKLIKSECKESPILCRSFNETICGQYSCGWDVCDNTCQSVSNITTSCFKKLTKNHTLSKKQFQPSVILSQAGYPPRATYTSKRPNSYPVHPHHGHRPYGTGGHHHKHKHHNHNMDETIKDPYTGETYKPRKELEMNHRAWLILLLLPMLAAITFSCGFYCAATERGRSNLQDPLNPSAPSAPFHDTPQGPYEPMASDYDDMGPPPDHDGYIEQNPSMRGASFPYQHHSPESPPTSHSRPPRTHSQQREINSNRSSNPHLQHHSSPPLSTVSRPIQPPSQYSSPPLASPYRGFIE